MKSLIVKKLAAQLVHKLHDYSKQASIVILGKRPNRLQTSVLLGLILLPGGIGIAVLFITIRNYVSKHNQH